MVVDAALLRGLASPTALILIGKVDMTAELPPELLENISALNVEGKMTIGEDAYRALQGKLKNTEDVRLTIVPEGYRYVSGPLFLDAAALGQYQQAGLYSADIIRFGDDINEELLNKHIRALYTTGSIICTEALRPAVLKLCTDPSVRILHHAEELILVEGRHTLTRAELGYRPDRFSLLVYGALKIQEDLDPRELFDRLEWVDKFGEISAGEEQLGALQARLRTREGALVNLEQRESGAMPGEQYLVQNVGYFTL